MRWVISKPSFFLLLNLIHRNVTLVCNITKMFLYVDQFEWLTKIYNIQSLYNVKLNYMPHNNRNTMCCIAKLRVFRWNIYYVLNIHCIKYICTHLWYRYMLGIKSAIYSMLQRVLIRKKKGANVLAEVFESRIINQERPTKLLLEIANSMHFIHTFIKMSKMSNNFQIHFHFYARICTHTFTHKSYIFQVATFDCGRKNWNHSQ